MNNIISLKELQKHQVQRNLQVKLHCTWFSSRTRDHDKNQDPLTLAPLSSQPSSLSSTDPVSVFAAATHNVVWAPQVRKHGTTTTKKKKRDETGPEVRWGGSRTGKRRKWWKCQQQQQRRQQQPHYIHTVVTQRKKTPQRPIKGS